MIATRCPSTRQISDYLLGKLDDPSFDEIDRHLEECPECREAAGSLDRIPDALLHRLRGPATIDLEDTDFELGPALEQIRAAVPSAEQVAREAVEPQRIVIRTVGDEPTFDVVSTPTIVEPRRSSFGPRSWAVAAGLLLATAIGGGLAAVGLDDDARPGDRAIAPADAGSAKEAFAAAVTAAGERQQQAAKALQLEVRQKNSLGMELTLIPAGEFLMGSTAVEMRRAITLEQQQVPAGWPMHYFIRKVEVEFPQHTVTFTKPFLIGTHELTVGQWDRFVAESGYKRPALANPDENGPEGFGVSGKKPEKEQTPMTYVTWDDATAFCDWLGAKENRVYRLPTEAEWEYACRAGTTTRWFTGDDESSLRDHAWTLQNCGTVRDGQTQNSADVLPRPVGEKQPNPFGLHDMTGNVWEWCRDNFRETYYANSPAEDPPGPEMLVVGAFSKMKMLRGGGNGFRENESRSATRWFQPANSPRSYIGFRVVCELPATEE